MNSQSLEYYNCFIQPGQVAYSKERTKIYSVCGNGVLVVLRDRKTRAGGMAHCIYPKVSFNQQPTNYHTEIALNNLIRQLQRANNDMFSYEAQIFGGGHYRDIKRKRAVDVIKQIKKILKKFKINVISEDVGGSLGRKIVFDTYSGEVLVFRTSNVRMTDWLPEYHRK